MSVRVDMEKFREAMAEIHRINKIPLAELKLYENDKEVEISNVIRENWRFVGLSNSSLLEEWPKDPVSVENFAQMMLMN